MFNPDTSISPVQAGNSLTKPDAETATPDQWFNDLDSGSQLPIGLPVSPDFGNPKGINERVDMVMAHLLAS